MPKRYYFQAPTFDINPDTDISPRLGSIFRDFKTLTSPLNQDAHITVPENLMIKSNLEGFREDRDLTRGFDIDWNASLIHSLVGSVDVMYGRSCDKNKSYLCEELETLQFDPTQEYVSESIIASQRAQTFLDKGIFGHKYLYMVTGLKIATGFAMSSNRGTYDDYRLKISGDAALAGFPVGGGPGCGITVADSRRIEHGRTANKIVFAYRSIRIRRRCDGTFDSKLKDGGIYSHELSDGENDDSGGEAKWKLEPVILEGKSENLTEWEEIGVED